MLTATTRLRPFRARAVAVRLRRSLPGACRVRALKADGAWRYQKWKAGPALRWVCQPALFGIALEIKGFGRFQAAMLPKWHLHDLKIARIVVRRSDLRQAPEAPPCDPAPKVPSKVRKALLLGCARLGGLHNEGRPGAGQRLCVSCQSMRWVTSCSGAGLLQNHYCCAVAVNKPPRTPDSRVTRTERERT